MGTFAKVPIFIKGEELFKIILPFFVFKVSKLCSFLDYPYKIQFFRHTYPAQPHFD
jgi:hypothetical protein